MKRLLLSAAVLGVATLAACGGGGGGSSAPSIPAGGGGAVVTPTTTPTAAAQSFTAANVQPIPQTTPGQPIPVPLPSASGASASAQLPASTTVASDTTVDAQFTTVSDATLPALFATRRPDATRATSSEDRKGLAYLKFRFSQDITLAQAPAFSFTLPGTFPTTGVTYWLAFYDPLLAAAGWQLGWEGPATVTATTKDGLPAATFAFASNGKPVTFVANQTYAIALVQLAATAASPTPVPSSIPSNSPQPRPAAVSASPNVLAFTSVTAPPVVVTFTQPNGSGSFRLYDDCKNVVSYSPTDKTTGTITVTPLAPGRCVIVGAGDKGSTAVIHIGVVTAPETPRPSASPRPSESPHAGESASPHPSESPEPRTSASPEPRPSASPEPHPSSSPVPSASPTPTR